MKLGKLAEYYYTAAEARKVLGVDESTFQYWGRTGRISRTTLPGRKNPVYSKREIDELAQEIEATVIMEMPKDIEFKRATAERLEDENQLAQLVFGRDAAKMPRKAFIEANPDVDFHLYKQGKLVAYITIFPLTQEALARFMNGEIRGWQIEPKDIEPLVPGKPVELLVMDMVTTPTVPPTERAFYGRRLLTNLLRVLYSWGEQGIEITKIHAVSSRPSGQRIIQNAGFKEVKPIGHGKIAYQIDLENADEKIFVRYREILKRHKNSNDHKIHKNHTANLKPKESENLSPKRKKEATANPKN